MHLSNKLRDLIAFENTILSKYHKYFYSFILKTVQLATKNSFCFLRTIIGSVVMAVSVSVHKLKLLPNGSRARKYLIFRLKVITYKSVEF